MQVDFLRENKDCSVCFHPVHVKFENGQRNDFIFPMLEQLPRKSKQRFYLADLVQGNFIQTNSVVYRWRFRDGLPRIVQSLPMPWRLVLASAPCRNRQDRLYPPRHVRLQKAFFRSLQLGLY